MKLGFDIVAAASIVLLASVTGWASISSIYEMEHSPHSMTIAVTPGHQTYFITQAQRCVGSFDTNLVTETPLRSNFQMSMRIASDQGLKLVEAKGDAAFNPLGQLVAGHIEVTGDDGKILLSSTNANPIELAIAVKTASEIFKHKFSIPGPVALKRISAEHYELHFPKFNASLGTMAPLLNSLLGPSSLQMVNAQESSPCKDSKESGLVLESANSKLQMLLQSAFKAGS